MAETPARPASAPPAPPRTPPRQGRPPASTPPPSQAAQEEAADAAEQLLQYAEEAFSLELPPPVRREAAAGVVADYRPPEPDEPEAEVARLLAQEIAAAYAKFGLPAPASAPVMETELLAEGDPVVALGPGGEGKVVLTPQELRERERRVAGWAKEIMRAPSQKANAMLTYLRDSPPMDVLNPEARVVIINGIKMPLHEGMLRAKLPGRLPGRASAGPDGRPRWGCVAIAEIIGDWGKSRSSEKAYRRYAKQIIIHGSDQETQDMRDAAYAFGDLEVLGT